MRRMRAAALISVLALGAVFVGCGQGQKVGSEKILDFEEQKGGGPRLGERTAAPVKDPGSLTVGETKAPATPTPVPKATPSYFDIQLVTKSPFYKPDTDVTIRAGVTLRVTNKDLTPERSKGRSFTDKHGAFHSGLIKPGGQWTWLFDGAGEYEIIDEGLNGAVAYLRVVP